MTEDPKTIKVMAAADKQIDIADGDFTVTEQWLDNGNTIEIIFWSS
ncbi:MAG: hypothetical protein OXB99_02765 [Acidimicrobiaceae bacterium]|nr:hypothetical protein [Acidimicrobiaceae bacterium]